MDRVLLMIGVICLGLGGFFFGESIGVNRVNKTSVIKVEAINYSINRCVNNQGLSEIRVNKVICKDGAIFQVDFQSFIK